MGGVKRILFPYDFSSQAAEAARYVGALARRVNANVTVTVCSVVPPAFDFAPPSFEPRIGDDPAEWKLALGARLDLLQ